VRQRSLGKPPPEQPQFLSNPINIELGNFTGLLFEKAPELPVNVEPSTQFLIVLDPTKTA
jgi:hypothetical protein